MTLVGRLEQGYAPDDTRRSSATVSAVYEEHFDFVWRSVRRLGVPEENVDDIVHDVFLVVHQRLATFEARSSLKTWLFGIVTFVCRSHVRKRRSTSSSELDSLATEDPDPFEVRANRERLALLHLLLGDLDFDKRAVFILAELEELSAREISVSLGIKLNTVYSRLKSAREEFGAALKRRQIAAKRKSAWK